MKHLNVAVVGCGTVSVNHLAALLKLDRIKIKALCDIKPERAEARRDEYAPEATIYDDYEKMLAAEELDAVHICTPHYLHAEMTLAALERGINVLLEKPMCVSREEIVRLIEAEKKSRARVTVCFQNRFNQTTLHAKRIAEEDGGVTSAYGTIFWDRRERYYKSSDWRGSYSTEGGGVMINQAIHTLDLLCEFLGRPERLWATKSNHHLKGVIEVEDSCEGLIEFEGGRRASFYATTAFEGGDATCVFLKTEHHKIEIRPPYLYVDGRLEEGYDDYTDHYVGKECYGVGHRMLISLFYDAILEGKEMPVTLESAQYALRILLAAYDSNDEETPV